MVEKLEEEGKSEARFVSVSLLQHTVRFHQDANSSEGCPCFIKSPVSFVGRLLWLAYRTTGATVLLLSNCGSLLLRIRMASMPKYTVLLPPRCVSAGLEEEGEEEVWDRVLDVEFELGGRKQEEEEEEDEDPLVQLLPEEFEEVSRFIVRFGCLVLDR